MRSLTARDIDTLRELAAANGNLADMGRDGWAKPKDCGGRDGSHHSETLAKLVRHGFAARLGYSAYFKSVWSYKISAVGMDLLSNGSTRP